MTHLILLREDMARRRRNSHETDPYKLRELPRLDLRLIEDRRLFHPLGSDRPAGAVTRDARKLVVKPTRRDTVQRDRPSSDPFLSWMVGFAIPDFVAACVRRKRRREVMHAKKKTGKRGSGGSGHRNWLSDIVC